MINKKIAVYKLLLPLISMVTILTLGIPNSLAISPKDKVIPDSEKRIVLPKEMMADSNTDSKVTLSELCNYSSKEVLKINIKQHVQKYSEFEDFVIFARY